MTDQSNVGACLEAVPPEPGPPATSGLAWLVTLGAVGVLLAACGGDMAGEAGPSYDTMPRLALVPGAAFCAGADDEGCQFTDIVSGAVGPDGRVALASMQQLSQFDSTGHFVRMIGRVGGGPGEYRTIAGLSYDRAGTLLLYDLGSRRLVSFDSAGSPRGSSRAELPSGAQELAFAGGRLVFAVLPGAASIGDSVETRFLTLDDTGGATVVLGRAPARAITTGDGTMRPITAPFSPAPRWGIGAGGLFFTEGGALRITRADGATPRVVVDMAVDAPPVTAADRDSVREVALRSGPGGPMLPGMEAALRRDLEQALASSEGVTTHPMVRSLVSLSGGTLWAREAVTAAPDSIRWNGFDSEGRPLGYILLPARARILAGDRDRMLVVTHDAMDVPRVRWYDVGAGGP